MTRHQDAASIGPLLRQVRSGCVGLKTPTCCEAVQFREFWQTRINVPYLAPRRDLLPLLVLNRAVAHLAPSDSSYPRQASANVARIHARLGAPPGEAVWEATEEEERWWLRWLCVYSASSPPPTELPAGAEEPQGIWEAVARGCSLLTEPLAGRKPLRHLASEATKTDSEGTPLWFVGHLASLELARRYMAISRWEQAMEWAGRAGDDGELIAARAYCQMREPEPDFATSAAFRAYRARRLASRCHALGFHAEAARWEDEATAWDQLQGGGGDETEGDDPADPEELMVSV